MSRLATMQDIIESGARDVLDHLAEALPEEAVVESSQVR